MNLGEKLIINLGLKLKEIKKYLIVILKQRKKHNAGEKIYLQKTMAQIFLNNNSNI